MKWALLVALVPLVTGAGCKERTGDIARRVIGKNASSPKWSRDSRYLFYREGDPEVLCRYDVQTRRKDTFKYPPTLGTDSGWDMSPDGRFMARLVYRKPLGSGTLTADLEITDLVTRQTRTAYSTGPKFRSTEMAGNVVWLEQDRLLFYLPEPTQEPVYQVYRISDGRIYRQRMKWLIMRGIAGDGSGYLSCDSQGRYQIISVATGKPRAIAGKLPELGDLNVLYQSRRCLVYIDRRDVVANGSPHVLNLATMKDGTVKLPEFYLESGLSPDLRWCWTTREPNTRSAVVFGSAKLEVFRVPEAAFEEMSRLSQQ